MNVHFHIKETKSGVSSIYVEFQVFGHRIHKSTGLKVQVSKWNKKRGLPRPDSADLVRLKNTLEAAEDKIKDFLSHPRTKQEILERVSEVFSERPKMDFWGAWDLFLDHQLNKNGKEAFVKYRSTRNNLRKFAQDTERILSFSKVDEAMAEDWVLWFNSRDYSPNTSGRALGFLKTFMRWTERRGLHESRGHQDLKIKTSQKEVVFLSMEEVTTLIDANLPERLDRVRDLFVLGCLTGLRFSDLVRVGPDNIGERTLVIRTEKDEDRLEIPLSGQAITILDKYLKTGRPLPKITNQKGNKYLKEMAKRVGLFRKVLVTRWSNGKRADKFIELWEVVTWHMARRTFITLSLELGMDPMVIIRITGHADLKALKPYLAISDKLKREQMDKAWGGSALRRVK